jgi:mRNA interferase MazF
MADPGDVVVTWFRGAALRKKRPAVVISTDLYHAHHPDVIVALVTTQLADATTPTDYVLQDWAPAGLHKPSAVRVYLDMGLAADVSLIGRLSDRDWQEVQARLRLGLAVT